jgi:hypothetical protein
MVDTSTPLERFVTFSRSHLFTPMTRTPQAQDSWFLNTAARQIRDEELKRAERLNGRVAMLGFAIGLIVEAFSGDGILQQIADLAMLSQH